MPQQSYLQIFTQRWIAIAAGLVVGILVALLFCFAIPASYTATATSFLTVRSSAGTLTDGSQFALARISSYPALADSSDVLGATIKQLGLKESVQTLANSVSATNPATTVLVQVSATAHSAKESALIANTVSTNLASTVSSLENSGSQNR
jgi:capsular polysaccharide biosynthesis protein